MSWRRQADAMREGREGAEQERAVGRARTITALLQHALDDPHVPRAARGPALVAEVRDRPPDDSHPEPLGGQGVVGLLGDVLLLHVAVAGALEARAEDVCDALRALHDGFHDHRHHAAARRHELDLPRPRELHDPHHSEAVLVREEEVVVLAEGGRELDRLSVHGEGAAPRPHEVARVGGRGGQEDRERDRRQEGSAPGRDAGTSAHQGDSSARAPDRAARGAGSCPTRTWGSGR